MSTHCLIIVVQYLMPRNPAYPHINIKCRLFLEHSSSSGMECEIE